jgi:NAD-dependent dihydropyrimidine dehydrogenase PreA subunit
MKYIPNVVTLKLFADRCTGCGRCIEVCPHTVFAKNGKTVHIVDRDRCIECGACMMNCAFGAIQVNPGVGCAAAIINGLITGGEPQCGCGGSSDASECSCC